MTQVHQAYNSGNPQIVVARQAIFDVKNKVIGYELLHHRLESLKNTEPLLDTGVALDTIAHGIDLVVNSTKNDQKIFINLPRQLLSEEKYLLLNKDKFILELVDDTIDEVFYDILSRAKSRGYLIAFDDADNPRKLKNILPYIDYVKVNFNKFKDHQFLQTITNYFKKYRLNLLAERVETPESMDFAKHLGYQFFQGFFFSTPQLFYGRTISPSLAIHFNLLYELNKGHTDYARMSEIISSDPVLSFKLLKFVNSPFFGQREPVTSIKRALIILGRSELTQWININLLSRTIYTDTDKELVYMSAFRSRFLSSLRQAKPSICNIDLDMCLPSLFSLLDAILKIPFKEIFSQINCFSSIKNALENKSSRCHQCINLATHFERHDIERIAFYKKNFPGVDLDHINLDAHMWSNCATK